MVPLSSLKVKSDAGFTLVATSAVRGICHRGRKLSSEIVNDVVLPDGEVNNGSPGVRPQEWSCYAMPLQEGLVLGTPDSLGRFGSSCAGPGRLH